MNSTITPAPTRNSSFSTEIPQLQIAWDSTSMGTFKECPRKYQLSIIQGWQPRKESVHLTFGLLFHGALERYDHLRAEGKDYEQATLASVRWTLEQTWDRELNRPWNSDDANKNRFTLVRSIVWYLENFKDDPIKTVILSNGKPAVELSFRMELEYSTSYGVQYILCGHLDRVGELNDKTYIIDRKTTKNTISADFFSKFSPDNQFSTYIFAGKVVYSIPLDGLIVDAAQVAITFSRFQRDMVKRSESQIEEWYKDFGLYLTLAEHYAKANYWPMNDKSCGNYGGCPFRGICSKAPSVREQWLKVDFHKRVWDPLQVRGDI